MLDDNFITRYIDRFQLSIDPDFSIRQQKLHILQLFKEGRIYDNLPPWESEYQGSEGDFIRTRNRRPCVIYKIPKIIVNDSISMLFGEGRFPLPKCDDEKTVDFLNYVTRCSKLKYKMVEAARIGSLGSVCVVIKVLDKRFYLDVMNTITLTPYFDVLHPDCLVRLVDKKKILGETLISNGYKNIQKEDKKKWFFLKREWTQDEEIHYLPYPADSDRDDEFKPFRDEERSVRHSLGFLPAVWIKNTSNDAHIDGHCTFEDALDIYIEIDYQLSQLGRLLKYNSDPTLVIKNASKLEGRELIKGSGALELDINGDAYLVEMSTGATSSVIDYTRVLREYALEVVRGNRSNPDKMSALHSGKALQMLNSPLISLVDELRLTYGDYGLIKIYEIMLSIYHSGKYQLALNGHDPGRGDYEGEITLDWGEWYPPTPQDDMQQANALTTLCNPKKPLISIKTAVESISDKYNITNVKEELHEINS